ncbi:MAG: lipid-A-disaccharide synthase [Candidatus Midichloriaceae bacterium]|jgi:lipid-A-disaccharide synthase
MHKIFISAGEASGDILGANLIKELDKDKDNTYKFFGIGGDKIENAGKFQSLFPMSELSITGYVEVIGKIWKLIYYLIKTIVYIRKIKPDMVITIDSPGFNFIFVKYARKFLKNKSVFIHYVAPTVWAYNPQRAIKTAKLFDHMLLLFPFEKKYFDEVGLKCSYVGNPHLQNWKPITDENKSEIKEKYKIKKQKTIGIIAGSRLNELKYHIPVLIDTINMINSFYKEENITFIIPTLKHLEGEIKKRFCMKNVIISSDENTKNELLNICDLILCKSGTSVLESMSKMIPIIVFYKMNSYTASLIKKKLMIKYVTICNHVMNKSIIPELLQDDFNPKNLFEFVQKFLDSREKKHVLIEEYKAFFDQINKSKITNITTVIKNHF